MPLLIALFACNPSEPPSPAQDASSNADSNAADAAFLDVTEAAGLEFLHRHGGRGERTMIETMGAGGGFFDLDRDGWLDIYLVQSGALPGQLDGESREDQVFRNLGPDEAGLMTFENVTGTTGSASGYGMGVCFADIDNDGFTDVYVSQFGDDRLFRNAGGTRLVDITETAGIDNPAWGAGCAFADYDRDGCLDLYVVNYVEFDLQDHRRCFDGELHVYCHPDVYAGAPDVLYRSRCDGTFEDVTAASGVLNADPQESKGLGVVWSDIDGDGDVDLYVANDSTRNFLYLNEGSKFREVGVSSATAFNDQGATEAGMGTDAGDVDGDGRFDLFVAHLDFETNTLYRNLGGGLFFDSTATAGLAAPSMRRVGFGSNFFDADNDGDLDLFVANGHIIDNIQQQKPSLSYGQPDQLFINAGDGRFREAGASAGDHFTRSLVGRASAVGDFDNDGDLDLLITHNHQRAVLLENRQGSKHPSLTLRLVSRHGGRDAIGAKATLVAWDGTSQVEEIRSGSSYLSQGDLRLHFGLGQGRDIDYLEIRWPEGDLQRIPGSELTLNQTQTIFQAKE
ncbi:MAG: CRTAC1 family protein [Acidobacteriota bacterium]